MQIDDKFIKIIGVCIYIKRLYISVVNIYISISCAYVCICLKPHSTLYTHTPVQTAGDPGITEDPLGYFSAISVFLQARLIPGEAHDPRAGLA